jgi:hypothetical protein
VKRYHHDAWMGHNLGGYWYSSAGIGRNGQPVSNKRPLTLDRLCYKVVSK